jgi:hypothetical protein
MFEIDFMKKIFYLPIIALLSISCSQQQNLVKNNFQDSDLDGIHDSRDACPFEPGSIFNLGCPEDESMKLSATYDKLKSTDADLDGVPDDKDECPNLYGSPFNQGCPFVIKVD